MAVRFEVCGGEAKFESGKWWYSEPSDDDWIILRYVPKPKTTWETFWYHIHHGMLMRYGVLRVVKFSLLKMREAID